MSENEIGYRGSKSANKAVKEQRVDGSWSNSFKKKPLLRYTLMDCENSYQVRILFKQLKSTKQSFSTVSVKHYQLSPYFVTGFCDAESSFQISVTMNKASKLSWGVRAFFTIGLHSRDLPLLLEIQKFFDCGIIVKNDRDNEVILRVSSLQDLTNKIIPHFVKYPLLTNKAADFKLFKQVIDLMQNKAHLTMDGLQKIINIKASINLGLSNELKFKFINTEPVQRPTIKTNNIPDFN